ncbi:Polyketide cyclase / dehydrase and lipid transport [Pseudarcicella hirudinis]|uniref:Polyketide cyclase / dehydrase and lipid transport n=2 Tax=Pseudarcicella hirudinis TaxID=1079859 RepID=A0A1I5MS00_9BACT|nr:SRPBCC family protein [Pseudarcicella hirudinis]SFP12364.1 Polyketide cyclase / dehydrase and lipid transport [Pseudarcicella hirudinis]
MKILKKILILLAVFIVLLLVLGLFTRKSYSVEREITINKPKQEVFDFVKFIKNQNTFNKWVLLDPKMRKDYRGTDGTVGFVYAWDSDNKDVGKGEQQITKIVEGERIDFEIRFEKPFASTAPAYMITESISQNQTKVKWGFSGTMAYPMNIMLLFVNIEDMLGKDLDTGLQNLKGILDK